MEIKEPEFTTEYLWQVLVEGSKTLDITLDNTQISQLFYFKDLLLDWNQKMNLTAITNSKDVVVKHFLDCLTIIPTIYSLGGADKNTEIIDIGTGAGFPGIPIKIACPHITLTLLDSLQKRVGFLNTVLKELPLRNVSAFHMRAEDGGRTEERREKYDFSLSRAVAKMSALSEYCIPYVKIGGYFIAMKGSEIKEELQEASIAIEKLGGEIFDVKSVIIPESDIKHSIVVIKKVRQTPSKYPRTSAQIAKAHIK